MSEKAPSAVYIMSQAREKLASFPGTVPFRTHLDEILGDSKFRGAEGVEVRPGRVTFDLGGTQVCFYLSASDATISSIRFNGDDFAKLEKDVMQNPENFLRDIIEGCKPAMLEGDVRRSANEALYFETVEIGI